MDEWRHSINIKDVIRRPDLEPVGVAAALHSKLRRLPGDLTDDMEIADIMDELNDLSSDTGTNAEDIDNVLEQLYDWADHHRVWLGP